MSLILSIDTAVQSASVCLANGNTLLGELVNPVDREAAGWLHTAIQQLMTNSGFSLQQIDAVSVSAGPGSYTGLRVGMATAKGLCYALDRPLIIISTLQMMVAAVSELDEDILRCPMIDARRIEVFTAVYTAAQKEVIPPHNLILEPGSFQELLKNNRLVFFGNGSKKFADQLNHFNALFVDVMVTAKNLIQLSQEMYEQKRFADVAYAEPFYGKAFYSPLPKKNY